MLSTVQKFTSDIVPRRILIDTYIPRLPILPVVNEELARLQITRLRIDEVRAKRISDGAAEILARLVLALSSASHVAAGCALAAHPLYFTLRTVTSQTVFHV